MSGMGLMEVMAKFMEFRVARTVNLKLCDDCENYESGLYKSVYLARKERERITTGMGK
jgi:NMD protein affecting ribosome stability and mRNA decay